MKKYELNPKEELRFSTETNTLAQVRKSNRPVIIGAAILLLLACFFGYVMKQIPDFYPLFILVGLLTVAALVFYLMSLISASKKEFEKYYITSARVLVCDSNDNILNDINNNSINKVVLDKVTGNIYDVILNPKEETNPTKLRKHNSNKPLYTADTVILKAVDGKKIQELLGK